MEEEILGEVGGELKNLNKKGIQIITEHGNTGEYLKRFKLKKEGFGCECGMNVESMEHIVNECNEIERTNARINRQNKWRNAGQEGSLIYNEGNDKKTVYRNY